MSHATKCLKCKERPAWMPSRDCYLCRECADARALELRQIQDPFAHIWNRLPEKKDEKETA